ncbi:hypothetical protein V2J09_000307 [Rumex salicifolius]
MNRGVFQSSPVQQMMAPGNPNWWTIAATRPPSDHQTNPPSLPSHHHHNNNFFPHLPFSSPSSNWPLNCSSINDNQDHQITPDSWSQQLFMNGIVGEEAAAMEQLVKQENFNPFVYKNNELFQEAAKSNNNNNFLWSPHHNTTATVAAAATAAAVATSPQSCVTTATKSDHQLKSECNSHAVNNGAAVKKANVQNSAPQSTFKVRKFGDRITNLHQLVSPFGKTDTASVLLEAIGYIRFLQSQIEALSLPYLSNGTENSKRQQNALSVQGERNGMFPEDSGQLLNDNCLKRKRGPHQEEPKMDLRSRGLCLVPVSCTMNVRRDNGADYWAPTLGGFH